MPDHAAAAGAAEPYSHAAPDAARLREIGRCLITGGAGDAAWIAAAIGQMERHGMPDPLIAALRRRIGLARPHGPPGVTAILFAPLEPVMLPAPRWRRGQVGIPRTAIPPIAGRIGLALGAKRAEFERMIAADSREPAARAIGRELWPLAAEIMASATAPADWTAATGARPADYADIAQVCAAAWRVAPVTETLLARPLPPGTSIAASVRAAMAETAGADRLVAASMVAILLGRPGMSERLAAIGIDLLGGPVDAARRLAADQAIDFLLDGMDAMREIGGDVALAAGELRRIGALLDAIELPGPAQRPSRRSRAEALRRKMDAAARARFDLDLSDGVLATAMLATPDATARHHLAQDAMAKDMAALESTMRGLKGYECAGRRIGGGESYERILRHAAGRIAALGAAPLVDRVRLVEILIGPEAALALL
jgi:hypothetical protein